MCSFGRPAHRLWLAGLLCLAGARSAAAERHAAGAPDKRALIVERAMPAGDTAAPSGLRLLRDQDGNGFLVRVEPDGKPTELRCGPLAGAWGLWVEDVDGDRRPDAVVALRKKARFDPVLENRLHVYALVGDHCVPMWRGTRLAGRFDQVNPDGGNLLALERIGRGRRRVARYHWTGFGYALDKTLWLGTGDPPRKLRLELSQQKQ